MRRPLHLTSCAALVLATLSLAACSGADPGSDAEPAGTPAAAAASGTAPGTALSYGDSATLVWQPTSTITGELELSVDTVAEQRPSVLDGWLRDDAMAASRPYFVTVTITNTGAADLGGQAVPVYLRDDDGRLGAAWSFGGDFTACQSGPLPTPFATGAETEMCLVYLAPDRARAEDVVFEPSEGYDPITWTGQVERPESSRSSRRG
ncbi:hypothetical protein EUA93_21140 [Nocardioides oleivorans]|uniref:DUF4352 domain-containing protein n=1 Tax=Nocardioides oleivorans TaxID=273676 RepID=A0A4Q2RQ44_9ACTN|nr:hypothetical protein [Nocardioides oleivorans]RYB89964.1 hypothetical protein EUA93_21140 [Nocardioides oleivorans]